MAEDTPNKIIEQEVIPELIEEAKLRLDGINQSIRVIEHKTYLLVLANFVVLGILWEKDSLTFLSLVMLALVIGAFVCFFRGLFDIHPEGMPGTNPQIWPKGKTNEKYRKKISANLFKGYQDAIGLSTKKHAHKREWYEKGYFYSKFIFIVVCLDIVINF